MAASDTKSSPYSPAEIAGRTFSLGRRGFEPEEVRGYLRAVAEHVARLEAEISRQRARGELLEHRSTSAGEAAYARVVRQLTDVVRAADEAALRMKAEAQAEADELLAAVRDEALRIAGSATEEAERTLADARKAAELLLGNARQEGERLVRKATTDAEKARELADQVGRLRSRTVHPSVPAAPADEVSDAELDESLDTVSGQLGDLRSSIWETEEPPPSPSAPTPSPPNWETALAWDSEALQEQAAPWKPEPEPPEDQAPPKEQAAFPDMNDPGDLEPIGGPAGAGPRDSPPEDPAGRDLWGSNGHGIEDDDLFSMEDLKDLDLDIDTSLLDFFDEPDPDA